MEHLKQRVLDLLQGKPKPGLAFHNIEHILQPASSDILRQALSELVGTNQLDTRPGPRSRYYFLPA